MIDNFLWDFQEKISFNDDDLLIKDDINKAFSEKISLENFRKDVIKRYDSVKISLPTNLSSPYEIQILNGGTFASPYTWQLGTNYGYTVNIEYSDGMTIDDSNIKSTLDGSIHLNRGIYLLTCSFNIIFKNASANTRNGLWIWDNKLRNILDIYNYSFYDYSGIDKQIFASNSVIFSNNYDTEYFLDFASAGDNAYFKNILYNGSDQSPTNFITITTIGLA